MLPAQCGRCCGVCTCHHKDLAQHRTTLDVDFGGTVYSGRSNRILITGITGFVGSHMAELAIQSGMSVFGSIRPRSNMDNIKHLTDSVSLIYADLRDASAARNLLDKAEPEYIVHLAAHSFVGTSWGSPSETLDNNLSCQINLFEALRSTFRNSPGMAPRFLVIGSSEEYGMVLPDELPIKEDQPLRPLSPYAVSKVGQDMMGYQYWQSYSLPIVRTRAFNHEGPRRGSAFVTSNFAQQIARIEANKQHPVIHVGDLSTRRDYTDVRDIVHGYMLLLQRGQSGEVYNLCSGNDWQIQVVLNYLLSLSKDRDRIAVEVDKKRLRPSDVPVLVGDNSKIKSQLGWKPEIPFTQTLQDTLTYWRQRV